MADDNDTFEEDGGLLQRIKESPRTVSALIIILIVAAAIYAFSDEEGTSPVAEESNEAATNEAAQLAEGGESAGSDIAGMEEAGDTLDAEAREGRVAAEITMEELPEPERTETGYVEVAQPGEGYTHVARRAAARWLAENQTDYAVTDEHRIYIEDYIQNQLGTDGMGLGQTQMITFDQINEAVAAAGELNEAQLDNLSQYTSALM